MERGVLVAAAVFLPAVVDRNRAFTAIDVGGIAEQDVRHTADTLGRYVRRGRLRHFDPFDQRVGYRLEIDPPLVAVARWTGESIHQHAIEIRFRPANRHKAAFAVGAHDAYPGNRASASAALMSGNVPIESDETTFTRFVDCRWSSWARALPRRSPRPRTRPTPRPSPLCWSSLPWFWSLVCGFASAEFGFVVLELLAGACWADIGADTNDGASARNRSRLQRLRKLAISGAVIASILGFGRRVGAGSRNVKQELDFSNGDG